jgi:putative membrane protein
LSDQESNRVRRIVAWGIVGLIVVIGVSIALSFYYVPTRLGHSYYPFLPFHFGWPGGIFLILIVFLVARWFFWPWRAVYRYPHSSAESILKERYAKGEITREQFEQMMHDIEHKGSNSG